MSIAGKAPCYVNVCVLFKSMTGKLQLCYEERLVLWTQYLPSFEQEVRFSLLLLQKRILYIYIYNLFQLLNLCERVLQLKTVSDSSAEIEQLVHTKYLVCTPTSHLSV